VRRARVVLAPVLALPFLLLLADLAGAAIAFDDSASAQGRDVTGLTWAHTVGAGSGRILIVGVSFRESDIRTLDSVTYGGSGLTLIGGVTDPVDAKNRVEIWKLTNPPVGTDSVSLTFSGLVRVVGGSASFTGVSQTAPHGAFTSAAGSSLSPSVVVASAAGDVVLDVVAVKGDANSATEGPGQTRLWYRKTPGGGKDENGAASTEPGAASVTMSWTLDTSADWAIGAISLRPGAEIRGRVFEDADFAGTAAGWDGGVADLGLANVDVELYDATDAYVASVSTGVGGTYTFSDVADGAYKVRARSATIGDADTAPAGTYNACVPATCSYPVPEMTWGNGSPSYGGQIPTVVDPATGDNAGPGDTWVPVTVSGADVTDVDFGFAYNLIVNVNDTGQGSLRQFLLNANSIGQANGTTASESRFRIPAGLLDGNGVASIAPATVLPIVSDDSTSVDGMTQTASVGDTNPSGPEVEIDGSAIGPAFNGLHFTSGHNLVRGLIVNRFAGGASNAIRFLGAAASYNAVKGCYIGTRFDGAAAAGNNTGIQITGGAVADTIGGAAAGEGNLIAGNTSYGVRISDAGTNGHMILGNTIGTNLAGTAAIPNNYGIVLASAASGVRVGASGAGNLISGNTNYGIYVTGATSCVVEGNLIGTQSDGISPRPNSRGIHLAAGATNFTIGGTGVGEGNVITYNTVAGVSLLNATTDGHVIRGNSIFSNGGLGIDLDPGGPGVGGGSNDDQAAPVIEAIEGGAGSDFAVYVTAGAGETVDFYRVENAAAPVVTADPSGFGEGYLYLGSCTDGGASTGPHVQAGADGDPSAGRIRAVLLASGVGRAELVTATSTSASGTSEFAANVAAGPIRIVKRAFQLDGTPVASGTAAPKGARLRYLLYVNNAGGAVADVSLQDVLDPAFVYQPGTILFDASVDACVDASCTGAEEAAIYAAAVGGTAGTDGEDADPVSVTGTTIDAGDASAGNARLDLGAGKVWAMVFTVKVN